MSGSIPDFLKKYIKKEVDQDEDEENDNGDIFGYNIQRVTWKRKSNKATRDEINDDDEDIDQDIDQDTGEGINEDIDQDTGEGINEDIDQGIGNARDDNDDKGSAEEIDEPEKPKKKGDTASFYLNNRLAFVKFITDRFKKEKSQFNKTNTKGDNDVCSKNKDKSNIDIMLHQKILLSYLKLETPYRGLLLYHGLGSGKTISSIAVFAEGYRNKKVFVICPKQLINNYQLEVEMYKMSFPYINLPEITYFGYTSSSDMEKLNKRDFDNKVVVIDEVHNFSNAIVNALKDPLKKSTDRAKVKSILDTMETRNVTEESEEMKSKWDKIKNISSQIKKETKTSKDENDKLYKQIIELYGDFQETDKAILGIYAKMKSAKNSRFILLSGTPIINRPFELAILFNILRGNMVTYKFSFQRKSNLSIKSTIMDKLKKIKDIDYFNVTTPSGNSEYVVEATQNPKFFMNLEKDIFKKQRITKTKEDDFSDRVSNELKSILTENIKIKEETVIYTAFPEEEDLFNKMYANPILKKPSSDKQEENVNQVKAEQLFKKRIIGLTSYFKGAYDRSVMAEEELFEEKLEMSEYQKGVYKEDIKKEKKGNTNMESSSYKVKSRQTCDFALPESCKQSGIDNTDVIQCLNDIIKRRPEFLNINATDEEDKLERYSPKYKKVIEQVNNGENKGTHLIYSNFIVRGTEIMALSLRQNEYIEMEIEKEGNSITIKNVDKLNEGKEGKTFISYRTEDSVAVKLAKRSIFNNDWKNLPDSKDIEGKIVSYEKLKKDLNKYTNSESGEMNQLEGNLVKAFIISRSSAEGITLLNTRYVHVLDPFWNPAVTTQVIGRARRLCSHQELDEKERIIKIYKYIMTNNNVKETTDQQLDNLSERKKNDMNTFLSLVKSAAVDCAIHNTSKSGYKCIAFPTMDKKDPGWSFIPETTTTRKGKKSS